MTKIALSSFRTEYLEKYTKHYRNQIKAGTLKVIKTGNSTLILHADTFEQMEDYLKLHYSNIWLHFKNRLTSFKRKVQDKDINDYIKSWEKPDKLNAQTKDFNITGDLQAWINFFVREIYLQPVYYYEATKKYPDTLPYESWIFQRWHYLNDKTIFAQNKYNELVQKEYRKLRKLLSVEDKEAIKTIKAIVLFTDNLLSEAPDYLRSTPIMAAFINAMFDLKKLYDFVAPNNGLPSMDKYFNNSYVSQFEVKFIPFDKDFPDGQPLDEKKNKEGNNNAFIPETEKLKDWIYPDKIPNFIKIEKELFNRKFIDNSYKWQKHKTELIDFTCIITELKYFRSVIEGNPKQYFHYRQFFSERYGFEKTGLTETWKKYKPSFKTSKATFFWIDTPDK